MPSYSVSVPDGEERGIRVSCDEHGESERFQPGYRRVSFHCEECGYEVTVAVDDLLDWRDMSEMC